MFKTIPMIDVSFMKNWLKTLTRWSTITEPEEKAKEALECHRLYENILQKLNKYFWNINVAEIFFQ